MEENIFKFKYEEFTKTDIINALRDIDNNKHKFSCKSYKKYALLYEDKKYPIKQVCECLCLSRNKQITNKDFVSNEELRQRFMKMGFEIINIEDDFSDINYYFAIWNKSSYDFARQENIIWKWNFDNKNHCHLLVLDLKPNDIILNYETNSKGKGSMSIISESTVEDYPQEKLINANETKDYAQVVKLKYKDITPIELPKIRDILSNAKIDYKYPYSPLDKNINPVNGGFLHAINKQIYDLLTQKKNENLGKDKITMDRPTQPLNQILYGPPGTGKTYNTVVKAIQILDVELYKKYDAYLEELKKNKDFKIIEENSNFADYKMLQKRYNELKEQGRIEFITFHQSYSYEEFVEGIKPYIPDWGEKNVQDVKYVGKDGIFKKMCCASIQDKYNYFKKMYDNGELGEFKTDKGKNYIISKFDDKTFEISRIDGTPNSCTIEKFKNVIFYEGDDLKSTNLRKKAGVGNELEMNLVEIRDYVRNLVIPPNEVDKKVLIIDEINRGNISKIFGELITLIEEDKRENVTGEDKEYNTIKVRLPYSGDEFSVPNNLYIIGTMNTADRSIALLDTALRRRFDFEEMMPDLSLLDGKSVELDGDNIDLQKLLEKLNKNICEKGDLDKNHQIGHAYLINVDDKEKLRRAFLNKIYPLLEEYFYDEEDKIKKVLDYTGDLSKIFEPNNKTWENIVIGLAKL